MNNISRRLPRLVLHSVYATAAVWAAAAITPAARAAEPSGTFVLAQYAGQGIAPHNNPDEQKKKKKNQSVDQPSNQGQKPKQNPAGNQPNPQNVQRQQDIQRQRAEQLQRKQQIQQQKAAEQQQKAAQRAAEEAQRNQSKAAAEAERAKRKAADDSAAQQRRQQIDAERARNAAAKDAAAQQRRQQIEAERARDAAAKDAARSARDAEKARIEAAREKQKIDAREQRLESKQDRRDEKQERLQANDPRPPAVGIAPPPRRGLGRVDEKHLQARGYRPPPRVDRGFDQVKRERREKIEAGGKRVVIRENDARVIVRENNRTIIRHDDADRLRRVSRDARTRNLPNGFRETVVRRPNGVEVIDVTDNNGRLVRRYRRDRGREVVIIDNRNYYRRWRRDRDRSGRDLAIGLGVGAVLGAAIIAMAPPRVSIPRDEYIVDYGDASDDELYETLTAPPVERLERGYSLEEVRYSEPLRQRMRRVDLDTVTFDFGSWEISEDQFPALERMANAISRAIDKNDKEVFLIEGHTDAVGSEEDNLSLSDRRAQAVAEILTTAFDVPPENLVTQGYGEQYLKVNTGEPERLNRRIAVRRITPLIADGGDGRDDGAGYDRDPAPGDRAPRDDYSDRDDRGGSRY